MVGFITGIFFGGTMIIGRLIEVNIDKPSINVSNSTNVGIIYKSPNSFISQTTIAVSSDNCDASRYKNKIKINLTAFFEQPNCGAKTLSLMGLRYNIYNVRFVLPTKQEVFVPEILSGDSYIIAYFNEDYSDACIPHKYRIYENISQKVCFNFFIGENVCQDSISLSAGPSFTSNRNECYEFLSGDYDFLRAWNLS